MFNKSDFAVILSNDQRVRVDSGKITIDQMENLKRRANFDIAGNPEKCARAHQRLV